MKLFFLVISALVIMKDRIYMRKGKKNERSPNKENMGCGNASGHRNTNFLESFLKSLPASVSPHHFVLSFLLFVLFFVYLLLLLFTSMRLLADVCVCLLFNNKSWIDGWMDEFPRNFYVCLSWFTLPVSQWRNDEPFGASQKFILIFKNNVCDVDVHLVPFLIKVEATLLQPLKISRTSDIKPTLEEETVMVNIRK